MRRIVSLACFVLVGVSPTWAEDYVLGPDSQRKPGVPKGTVTQQTLTSGPASKLYSGTQRDYWIYVPAQYQARQYELLSWPQ